MKRPSVHATRLATLQWCFEQTTVAGNFSIKRHVLQSTPETIGQSETDRMLMGIFEQTEFLIHDREFLADDEINELWDYTVRHWNLKDHDELVDRLEELKFVIDPAELAAAGGRPGRYEHATLERLRLLREAEARQDDLSGLVEGLVADQAHAARGTGAW